jgi:hypothetical protein
MLSSEQMRRKRMVQMTAAGNGVIRKAMVLLMALVVLGLAGCGGTKVYTVDKSVVYKGSIYNLSNVQVVSSRVEGTLPSGDLVNLRGADKNRINALLDEHSSFNVATFVLMDQQEMMYQVGTVKKYSDFTTLTKNLNSAMGKIQKFMGDKKKRQLQLK